MNKSEDQLLLKELFLKLSNSINKICSEKCGVDIFEKHLSKVSKGGINILELNYEGSLDCYDKCLAKHFQSSFLGVGLLKQKFN